MADTLLDEMVVPQRNLSAGTTTTPTRVIPVGTRYFVVLMDVNQADLLDPAVRITSEFWQLVSGVPRSIGRMVYVGGEQPLDDNDQPTNTLRWTITVQSTAGRDVYVALTLTKTTRIGATVRFFD